MELEVFKSSMSSQCSSQVDLFKGLLLQMIILL
jgi:hypothetical protein